jgi:phosphoribosylformimino-5-aminoimidazole carboxamide ribonucleotide (ProFAR) isomerase
MDLFPAIDPRAGRVARMRRGTAGFARVAVRRALLEERFTLREARPCSSSR